MFLFVSLKSELFGSEKWNTLIVKLTLDFQIYKAPQPTPAMSFSK